MFITLMVKFITLSRLITILVILFLYRGVLHCREFITLLERNIIIIIFRDIPLVFMAAILKIGCVHVVYMYINYCYFAEYNLNNYAFNKYFLVSCVTEMCLHLNFTLFPLVTIFKSILLYSTSISIKTVLK